MHESFATVGCRSKSHNNYVNHGEKVVHKDFVTVGQASEPLLI